MSSSLMLPVITIDPTFPSVIQDVQNGILPSEKFWLSCYKTSQPSVHAKVIAELDEVNRDLVRLMDPMGDVEITQDREGNYKVSCRSLAIPPTRIELPIQQYLDPERSHIQHPQRITAFDVSPDTTRFATGFLDGSVFLYPTTVLSPKSQFHTPTSLTVAKPTRTTSRPHLSTVTQLQFFPSSRVLLSAGADFSLSILPADLPESTSPSGTRITPARTLRGHTRAVTATGIIGPGRNILSTSLDSTLKLWDVPSSTVIATLPAHSPILSASLGERPPVPPNGESVVLPGATDDREVPETRSKVVFCGLQDGAFEQMDLGMKRSVYTSSTGVGLTSINYSEAHHLLATGSSKGTVTLYDTRSLSVPLTSFWRNEAGIEDIAFVDGDAGRIGLAIATTDGLPYVADVVPEGPAVRAELVGGDCDPVRNVRVRGREVWSAGDDAVVRRYLF
ncbi:Proteasomal ATPase-associated factor 1 [Hypsizygus marmoreus]|uniref:Proteasomal ATPase-associated factor 1 n=1 Tax=Hypsizygus marmoreus TaxID=39966 RepID=A0A369J892_HYPMA|nr:Proteasomal ATPase-associated factor 1 [Hypsizygus marmoreus]